MMKQQVKQVPYGVSDFATVMSPNLYYVDKTIFCQIWRSSLAISSSSVPVVLEKACFSVCSTLTMTVIRRIVSKNSSVICGQASTLHSCKEFTRYCSWVIYQFMIEFLVFFEQLWIGFLPFLDDIFCTPESNDCIDHKLVKYLSISSCDFNVIHCPL